MLPSLATPEQLKDRTTVQDDIQAQAALDDASALVRKESSPETWVDDIGELTTVPDAIQVIVLRAAKRYLDNPEGYSSIQVSQFSASMRGASAGGSVFLTDTEKKDVRDIVHDFGLKSVAIEVDGLKNSRVLVEESTPWDLM